MANEQIGITKVDEDKCRGIRRKAEVYSAPIERIVDQLVKQYAQDLDEYMKRVQEMISRPDRLTDDEVENITLMVPVYMYWASNGVESLGIQGDNAKAIKMEAFNNAVLKTSGTIRDKESFAENVTINEYLVEVAFQRAYKKLKAKLDMAVHLCQASRKVLHKRITELDIHRLEPNYVKATKDRDKEDNEED